MIRLFIGSLVLALLSGCLIGGHDARQTDCLLLYKRGVLSMAGQATKKPYSRDTLKFVLSQFTKTIKCDGNLIAARRYRATTYIMLEEPTNALLELDTIIAINHDSTLFVDKGNIFLTAMNDTLSARGAYTIALKYLSIKLAANPNDKNLIFQTLFSKSALNGKESVRKEIKDYLARFPDDKGFEILLYSILDK